MICLISLGATSVPAANMMNNPDAQEIAYIGIATLPLGADLADQLKLQPGQGLVVESVDPKGPCKALLQPQDVLISVGDQVLFNEHQFSGILRIFESGQKVSLKVLRKSAPHTVEVVLGARRGDATPHPYWSSPHRLNMPNPDHDVAVTNWSNPHHLNKNDINEILAHIKESHQERIPIASDETRSLDAFMSDIRDKLQSVQWTPPLSPKDYRRVKPTDTNEVYIGTYDRMLSISDDSMSAKMTIGDGGYHLIVEDEQGNIVFEGPVNTREERLRVPGKAYKYMDHLEKLEEDRNSPSFH
jgi:hypothetical protein